MKCITWKPSVWVHACAMGLCAWLCRHRLRGKDGDHFWQSKAGGQMSWGWLLPTGSFTSPSYFLLLQEIQYLCTRTSKGAALPLFCSQGRGLGDSALGPGQSRLDFAPPLPWSPSSQRLLSGVQDTSYTGREAFGSYLPTNMLTGCASNIRDAPCR